jgi:structural maintenance of chromosome 4
MKPKAQTEHDEGLLEYLEDIIGTSAHRRSQKKEAEDYLRLKNEHVRSLSRLWQWMWRRFVNEEEFKRTIVSFPFVIYLATPFTLCL